MDDTNAKEKSRHLSFQDFLSWVSYPQLAGVSFEVAPELEQIHEILRQAEARERHFAARLESLKKRILELRPRECHPSRLTDREEEMVDIITLYQTIVSEKENAAELREKVSDKIAAGFVNMETPSKELSTPEVQDPKLDMPSGSKKTPSDG